MAFTVEDGSALPDSNAYISVAFFQEYHADRGHASAASLVDADVQTCIVRASDYIDKRFGRKFRGKRTHQQQAMEWPRLNAVDDDGFVLVTVDEIPRSLMKACAEYALRAAVYSELAPDPLLPVPTQDFTDTELPDVSTEQGPGAIAETAVKVDVIEESVRFASPVQRNNVTGGKQSTSSLVGVGNIPEYPAADLLMEELLTSGQRRLVRGS